MTWRHLIARSPAEYNMRGNMRGVMRGILVITMHDTVHIFQYNTEIGTGGMELRTQFLGVTGKLFRFADDLAQAAASVTAQSA